MPISLNEIRHRALAFAKRWEGSASENAQAKLRVQGSGFRVQGRSKMMLCRDVAGNVRFRLHRPTMQVSTVERLGLKANVGS